MFSIGRQSGVISTAATFDCEMKKEYYVTVVAEDGAPSDRANHYPSGTPNQGTPTNSSTSIHCVQKEKKNTHLHFQL